MPMTLAHPAAVLPLLTRLRPIAAPAALVLGSTAPDLAFYLPLSTTYAESHSFPGLLSYCLLN